MMGVCLHAPPPTSQKLGPIVNQTLSSFPQGFNTDTRPKLPLFLHVKLFERILVIWQPKTMIKSRNSNCEDFKIRLALFMVNTITNRYMYTSVARDYYS